MKKVLLLSIFSAVLGCSGSKSSGTKDLRCAGDGVCGERALGVGSGGANATFSPFKVPNAPEGSWTLKVDTGDLDPKTGLRLVKFSWAPFAFATRYKLNISLDSDCGTSYKSYESIGIFYDQSYSKEVLIENGIKVYACLKAVTTDQKEVSAENSPLNLDFSANSSFKFSLVPPLPSLVVGPTKISWTEMADAAHYEVIILDSKGSLVREYKEIPPTGPVMTFEIQGINPGKYQLQLNGIDKKGNKYRSLVDKKLANYDFIYSPNPTGQWSVVKGAGAPSPSPRSEVVMAATPNGILVWGGATSQGFANDGWIYKLEQKTWQKLPSPGLLEPRRASGTWTGTHLVIWGGRDFNKYTYDYSKNFGTGAFYSPSDNTWTTIATSNAPSPRYGHTLTPIGTSVLIWGGVDRPSIEDKAAATLGNGGIFDPLTQVWTPLSGTPSTHRSLHCAVWTGSQLLVFGGIRKMPDQDSLLINQGEIFDPKSMEWKPMSDKMQPAPRFGHTCAWTGKKLVVWGGYVGFSTAANGGVYDPQTDTWTPVDESNAPFAFLSETSLWTGQYLLVWGGRNGNGGFNQMGAIYNPETNQWQHLSLAGAPSPRWGTQAVAVDQKVFMYAGDTVLDNTKKGTFFDELYQLTLP